MKVAFVKPPVGGILGLEMLTFVEPLGPICVAACLEAEGHECKVYDLRIDGEEHGLALCRKFTLDPLRKPHRAVALRRELALQSDAVRREFPAAHPPLPFAIAPQASDPP